MDYMGSSIEYRGDVILIQKFSRDILPSMKPIQLGDTADSHVLLLTDHFNKKDYIENLLMLYFVAGELWRQMFVIKGYFEHIDDIVLWFQKALDRLWKERGLPIVDLSIPKIDFNELRKDVEF